MTNAGFVGIGVVLGWLASKTWDDPGCQLGLVVFLIAATVMALGFLVAVVGHRGIRARVIPIEEDEGDRPGGPRA